MSEPKSKKAKSVTRASLKARLLEKNFRDHIPSPASSVGYNPNLMLRIREFYELYSYRYLGCMSEAHAEQWVGPKKTIKHLVTQSRARISRLVHEIRQDPDVDGNLLITQCMRSAARNGCLRGVVRVQLYTKRCRMRLSSARVVPMMEAAARSGSIEMLEYFERRHYAMGMSTMIAAVRSENSVEVLRWLMDRGCMSVDDAVESEAAKIGNFPALKLLSERPYFPGFAAKVMTLAGRSGSVDTVNFLHECGCKLTTDLIAMASMSGHLDLVKYLRDLGCAWDTRVCWMAAYRGHLDLIEWARSQNPPCPWNSFVLRVALQKKRVGVVEFLRANNCPGS